MHQTLLRRLVWAAAATAVLLGGAACAQEGAPTQELPPLPDWAQQRPTITGNWLGSRRYNLRLVERANATNRLYDVVFYGDSLVALIPFIDTNFAVFGEFFGQGHWAAAALGVGGSTVEELTYRIVAGGERFSQDPLVIVIQIGLMNRLTDNVGGKLGWLLGWLGQAMPATHVAVLAPYPSVQRTSAVLWQQMRPYVRARWPRVMPSMCGSNLNPANRTVYEQDGIHLTAEGKPGYRSVFTCLKPLVAALAVMSREERGLPLPPTLN